MLSPPSLAPASQRTLARPATSTADYDHVDGALWKRPYDLSTMGTPGATVMAAHGGMRYVWLTSPDHWDSTFGFSADSAGIYVGYSNDPGIPPQSVSMIVPGWPLVGTGADWPCTPCTPLVFGTQDFFAPFLVYNPDDATHPFYIYAQMHISQTIDENTHGIDEGLVGTSDFVTFTPLADSHSSLGASGFTAYQTVYRIGTGNWVSVGGGNPTANDGSQALWTSTNGVNFTWSGAPSTKTFNNRIFELSNAGPTFTCYTSLTCVISREDARQADGGMYVTLIPVDSSFNIITSDPSKIVRLSAKYNGNFPVVGCCFVPDTTYLNSISSYLEDGLLHIYALHGFFTDIPGNTPPITGMHQQFVDYYVYPLDATAAANSAPVAVTVSADSGVATLSWANVGPASYRVYRGTTSTSQTTLLGDTSGLSFTDTPTIPFGQIFYYKVVRLNGSTEEGSRVVSTYVSSSSQFVNQHITRVINDGCDAPTIDRDKLDQAYNLLNTQGLLGHLFVWTNPAFCVSQNASHVVSKVYDLGASRIPRLHDFTPDTTNTTYDPLGMNGVAPGILNSALNAHGRYGVAPPLGNFYGAGRFNNLRQLTQLTAIASYFKNSSSQVTPLSYGEFGGFYISDTGGSPGTATFFLGSMDTTPWTVTATAGSLANNSVHVIGGTEDGANVIAYADGTAGSTQTGILDNSAVFGPQGQTAQLSVLVQGTINSKFVVNGAAGVGPGGAMSFDSLNQAPAVWSDLMAFDIALTPTQMAAVNTLLQSWYTAPTPAMTSDITTFTNCNGSGNDEPGFATWLSSALTFQSTHAGQLIELTVPAGKTCMFNGTGTGASPFAGLQNFRLRGLGAGATFSDNSGAGNGFFLGGGTTGVIQDNAHSARINTVSSGATTVRLKNTALTSLFNVGDWALVTGVDLGTGTPGAPGYPPNPAFWDYVKVSAINGGTGDITFATTPLTNSYKDTWPLFTPGDSTHTDQGGPATIYAIGQNWNTQQEYNNITFSQVGQTNAIGRDIALKNVTMTGANCVIPSQNQRFQWIKTTGASCVVEADKIVGQINMINSSMQSIHFQSASIKQFGMSGSTFTSNLLGTPIDSQVFGSTIASPSVGALCCGVSTAALFHNSTIGAVSEVGASQNNVDSAFSMSGGALTQALTSGPASWAAPGGNYYFLNGGGTHFPFTITDMTMSGGNYSIITNLGGGFPSAGPLSVHAAPVTVTIN